MSNPDELLSDAENCNPPGPSQLQPQNSSSRNDVEPLTQSSCVAEADDPLDNQLAKVLEGNDAETTFNFNLISYLKTEDKNKPEDGTEEEVERLKQQRKKVAKSEQKLLKKQKMLETCAKKLEEEVGRLEAQKLDIKFQLEDLAIQKRESEEQAKILEREKKEFESNLRSFRSIVDEIMDYSSALEDVIGRLKQFQV